MTGWSLKVTNPIMWHKSVPSYRHGTHCVHVPSSFYGDSKCAELSWKCTQLVVECYGAWGPEALKAFSQVATRLAIHGNTSKSMAILDEQS